MKCLSAGMSGCLAAGLLAVAACDATGEPELETASSLVCSIGTDDRTIDVTDLCFTRLEMPGGSAANWFTEAPGVAYTFSSAERENVGVWTFTVPETGYYTVNAWVPIGPARAPGVIYDLVSAESSSADDQLTRVMRDQNAVAGQWTELGSFRFIAGGAYSVTLGDDTGVESQARVVFSTLHIAPATATVACQALPTSAQCDAQLTPGGARQCAWYSCAQQLDEPACRAIGTPVDDVCPGFAVECWGAGTSGVCDSVLVPGTSQRACAWYGCAGLAGDPPCRRFGTPLEEVCPL
jgi:hypothetical protein